MLTEKKYVESGGAQCPCCLSSNIQGGSVEINDGRAYQPVYCADCDAAWDDVYELSHATPSEFSEEQQRVFFSEPA